MNKLKFTQRLRNTFFSTGQFFLSQNFNHKIVLMYHDIGTDFHDVSPAFLHWQLEYISKNTDFLTLDDLDSPAHKTGVCLTFDDGYKSHRTKVLDILSEFNPHAIFFVTSDYVTQDNNYLSPDDLRVISDCGHTVGSHGKTHRNLTDLNKNEIRKELISSKNEIEQIVGEEVDSLAYPHGAYNKTVTESIKETGYEYGFIIGDRFISSGEDPLQLPRLWIHNGLSRNAFKGKLTKFLRYFNKIRQIQKWY